MAHVIQSSFASGEWSPLLEDRRDLKASQAACDTLQNFIVTPYGPARRRPGTQYITGADSNSNASWMQGFQFSATEGYMIEFGAGGNIYVYHDRAKVSLSPALTHPYSATELKDIWVAQINDYMYVGHENYPIRRLVRVSGDTVWSFNEVDFTDPPFRDENLDESHTIAVSGTLTVGSTVTLTGSTDTFHYASGSSQHVGAYWRIGHLLDAAAISIDLRVRGGGTETSDAMKVRGNWEISTFGNWTGVLTLQKRQRGGAWKKVRDWSNPDADRNFSATGNEPEEDYEYRMVFVDNGDASSAGAPNAVLEAVESLHYGVVKITAVASTMSATATVIQSIEATTATDIWAEGSWSTFRGFPRTGTIHEQRLFTAGNSSETQKVWASDVDSYDKHTNFNQEDSDAFQFTIAAREHNEIQWLATSPRNLMVGTTGGEWSVSSGTEETLITPTNVRARRESVWGSQHLQAIATNNVILFVEQGARKLRELVYSFEQDGFISADLTQLSEHLTSGGIKQVAIQRHLDVTVWAVTGDGLLLSMTYDRQQETVAWSKHSTVLGSFESVAIISTADEEDEIWFCIKRTINGGTVRYIESFYPGMLRLQEQEDQDDLFFVDCGAIYDLSEVSE